MRRMDDNQQPVQHQHCFNHADWLQPGSVSADNWSYPCFIIDHETHDWAFRFLIHQHRAGLNYQKTSGYFLWPYFYQKRFYVRSKLFTMGVYFPKIRIFLKYFINITLKILFFFLKITKKWSIFHWMPFLGWIFFLQIINKYQNMSKMKNIHPCCSHKSSILWRLW